MEVNQRKPHKSLLEYFRLFIRLLCFDLAIFLFSSITHTFFRDIKTRGTYNIPPTGPVIFVIAPHHNQFIDGPIVMSEVKARSGRRISFLIAKSSYQRKIIGQGARLCSAIPVERAQDLLKPATGTVSLDITDPTQCMIIGQGTKFTQVCEPKGLLGIGVANSQIQEVVDDTHLRLKSPFKSEYENIQQKIIQKLSQGTTFKTAPHVDNHDVFQHVFDHLNSGRVLGIFPEGGSHDRPDLLPLKPGVAIMALGAIANKLKQGDNVENICVIPAGLNYFHAHRFRSRVVLEFGKPIIVNRAMGEEYIENPRESVNKLLEEISVRLREVTVTCPDYDTLMVLQACRRLHCSSNREHVPLPMVVEMNRRLVKSYQEHENAPDVVELRKLVLKYNEKLRFMGIHDNQVQSLYESNRIKLLFMVISRAFKVALFWGLSLPGVILFSPVFVIGNHISKIKQKQALAGSVVKIRATDVISTWKVLVALVIAPMLYIFHSIIGTVYFGHLFPFNNVVSIFASCYALALLTTYASLRAGEIGLDYYKSLKPLFISLISRKSNKIEIETIKLMREELGFRVNEFCRKYNPGIFEDYDRIYGAGGFEEPIDTNNTTRMRLMRRDSTVSLDLGMDNLGDIPIFANAPNEPQSVLNALLELENGSKREDGRPNLHRATDSSSTSNSSMDGEIITTEIINEKQSDGSHQDGEIRVREVY
ncbi:uncharacterized protein J8A68_006098 [[Candida] subhashii]|uniref:Phospholipid/glycerol acyltransferase domain-containing protein n=1 Tax=[Candida] subhashii TaxID=561895 RepID=A0A8J5UU35_9ASCO|nr:uncharacterized protein J8A68_006098 [[Candida] subhashii]KAG7660394.1 hypothetical protein J8A68_006098 [[Candida] subhashii]